MQQRKKKVPSEELGRGSPHKTSNRPYEPRSLEEEGDLDFEEGLASLKKFQSKHFGRLTLHLRKAALSFKMAADRLDYAEHLRDNTLEKFIKEGKE